MDSPISTSEQAEYRSAVSAIKDIRGFPRTATLANYQILMIIHEASRRTGRTIPAPPPPPERAELISLFESFVSSPTTTPMAVNQLRGFFGSDLAGTSSHLRDAAKRMPQPVMISPGSMEKSEFIAIIDRHLLTWNARFGIRQAREFLTDFTPTESAQTFPSNIDQRLEVARKVEKQLRDAGASSLGEASERYRDFRMNLIQLSVFLTVDPETLQVIESLTHDTWESSALFLESIEGFLKTFLVHYDDRVLKPREHVHMSSAIESATARDKGICAFNQSGLCDLICIWPIRLDDPEPVSEESQRAITGLLDTISPKLFDKIEKLLFGTDSHGKSDMLSSHWNIITVSPNFSHTLLARAQCALEPLGITTIIDEQYASIRVKWHWMPTGLAKALKSHGHISSTDSTDAKAPWLSSDLEAGDLATIIEDALQNRLGDAIVRTKETPWEFLRSGRQIQSGMCFELKVAKDDAHKMEVFLEARWFAVRVAAISGAAQAAKNLRRSVPESIWEAAMSSKMHKAADTFIPEPVCAPEATVDDDEINDQPGGDKKEGKNLPCSQADLPCSQADGEGNDAEVRTVEDQTRGRPV